MSETNGQASGQLGGLSWGELIEALVEAHGSLTAVAWKLVGKDEDVGSIERALRRLRTRGQRDGGRWGQKLIRTFGVPASIEARLRWMGIYHSPFNDLPVALCRDQLRLWDRPPVSTSRARIWVHLGEVTCALRARDRETARVHLERARRAAVSDDAKLEVAMVDAYLRDDAAIGRATELLASATLSPEDRACYTARLVDHRGYLLNKAGDREAAATLYETIPDGVHPFASYRRCAGLAFARQDATLARRAIDHAGDGGYTRLRAMGLMLLVKIDGDEGARSRAVAIAQRLGDEELLTRATMA